MVELTRRSSYNLSLNLRWNFAIDKITGETTKRLEIKNLPTLRNDSSFLVQDNGNFAVCDTIIKMFELHASKPRMQSTEYQATIITKISHNYT